MKIFKIKATFLFLLCLKLNAQLSTNEIPVGFQYNLDTTIIPVVVMPAIDTAILFAEDEIDEQQGIPPRFGYAHPVSLNLINEGIWDTLPNGDNICQLIIGCPGAFSINLLYDSFWLPSGAKFFIYNKNKTHHIGAFTNTNNKGTKNSVEGFATGLVYSDTIIVEYYLPKNSLDTGIINISGIVHGYKYINLSGYGYEYGYGFVPEGDFYNNSNKCQVNINCEEGAAWQNEKRAVALYLINGKRVCTGSLMNNTQEDFHPYFLTACHCIDNHPNASLSQYVFYWNYESPDCFRDTTVYMPPSTAPKSYSTNGAKLLAKSLYREISSDFALLELIEDPRNLCDYPPDGFSPYYLGWDATGNPGEGGVCIHHPHWDVKKISTYSMIPYTTDCVPYNLYNGNYFWKVRWIETTNGLSVTEWGSSGAALINYEHRVIGQLIGPMDCDITSYCDTNKVSNYGKFNVSWTGNANGTPNGCLSYWLDKAGTGQLILDGLGYGSNDNYTNSSLSIRLGVWTGSLYPYTRHFDTLYTSYGDCLNAPAFPSDTIRYKNKNGKEMCVHVDKSNEIYLPLSMNLADADWYINDSLVQEGTEIDLDEDSYYFHLFEHHRIWHNTKYDNEYIIVEARLPDGTIYTFKFRVYDHESVVSQVLSYWDDIGLDYEMEGNTPTITHCLTDTLKIPIANIGCGRGVVMNDTSMIWVAISNAYDSIIVPPTEELEVNIGLVYFCDCAGFFNFKIKCPPCDSVEIVDTSVCADIIWNHTIDSDSCGNNYWTVSASVNTNKTEKKIVKMKYYEFTFAGMHEDYFPEYDYGDGEVGVISEARYFPCKRPPSPPYNLDDFLSYIVYITLDDGTQCKSNFVAPIGTCRCGIFFDYAEAKPDTTTGNLNVHYMLASAPIGPVIIRVEDTLGVAKIMLYESFPSVNLSDTIYTNIDSLPPGNYNVVFQADDEIQSIPIVLVDNSIIAYADITPNPTDGFTNINYILKELPNSQLRVRVIHEITGFEHMTVFETPTKLQDRIELDVSSLMAGSYLVVLEVENSIFYLPVTLNIIKQ